MQSFDYSDDEFEALFAYLENPPVEEVVADAADVDGVVDAEDGMDASTLDNDRGIRLLILSWVLISVKNSFRIGLNEKPVSINNCINNIIYLYQTNINKFFSVLFVAIIGLKFVYDAMMGVGVTTNYQPKQPIAFSHKLHAGMNGVDCNYCHSSARHIQTLRNTLPLMFV